MKVVNITDNLKIKFGDFCTVLKWINSNDRSYVGEVLKVELVEHPFVIVSRCNELTKRRNLTLNINNVDLQPISKEFVRLAGVKPEQSTDTTL